MMTVLAANLVLNVYLVPSSGVFGAAYATMIAMLLYFLLFGTSLARPYRLEKGFYLPAGGAVYVAYAFYGGARYRDDGGNLDDTGAASMLFYFIGFFNGSERLAVQPRDGGTTDGGNKKRRSTFGLRS